MPDSDQQPGLSTTLRTLVDGFQVSQALHVAATLGLADLLAAGPRSSDDLAAATQTHAAALYRLVRALASVGVVHEDADKVFSLTPLGDCLRADAPEPVAGWAAFIGRPYFWNAWAQLLHSVQTGETAFRHMYAMTTFEYRALHPEESTIFDRAMTDTTRRTTLPLLDAYDFGGFGSVVDVGGGRGALLAALLQRHPHLQGTLFDQPHVVAGAEPVLRAAGVADRCRVVGGDFFVGVPAGADAYLLRAVIHDWPDPEAITILRACREAMPAHGKVLLIEWDLGEPNERQLAKFSDLNMLVAAGGQERTRAAYEALFAAADLQLVTAVPTGAGSSVFEGIPLTSS